MLTDSDSSQVYEEMQVGHRGETNVLWQLDLFMDGAGGAGMTAVELRQLGPLIISLSWLLSA